MSVSYNLFTESFLAKITEFDFLHLADEDRTAIVDGYMKRSINAFKKNCKYDLVSTADDYQRIFDIEVDDSDIDEIVDIVSEGMVSQWLKPYVYQQELLQNCMNTRDYSTYSPAELLHRVSNAYNQSKKDFINMIREYSYNHGDLTRLHL